MAALEHHEGPTARQLALLHVAKAKLELEESEYRDLLEASAGVRSASDLDPAGFQSVLTRLEQLGFYPRRKPTPVRPGMITPAQLDYLRALWRGYPGHNDERGLGPWLRRRFGVSCPRHLNRQMAHQTLVALKAMRARRREPHSSHAS